MKEIGLSKDIVEGGNVWKMAMCGIDEIQYLRVEPNTSIKQHGHHEKWEVWVLLSKKEAYVCLKEEQHSLENNTAKNIELLAVKGKLDYSYDELAEFLERFGISVFHGSIKIND